MILPHGVLFWAAADGHIGEHIIMERNRQGAVIGLTAKVF